MTESRCDFCYRPPTLAIIASRRTLWQIVMRRPKRSAVSCSACRFLAIDYVRKG